MFSFLNSVAAAILGCARWSCSYRSRRGEDAPRPQVAAAADLISNQEMHRHRKYTTHTSENTVITTKTLIGWLLLLRVRCNRFAVMAAVGRPVVSGRRSAPAFSMGVPADGSIKRRVPSQPSPGPGDYSATHDFASVPVLSQHRSPSGAAFGASRSSRGLPSSSQAASSPSPMQYNVQLSSTSRQMNSRFSSSPAFSMGAAVPAKVSTELLVAQRWAHLSSKLTSIARRHPPKTAQAHVMPRMNHYLDLGSTVLKLCRPWGGCGWRGRPPHPPHSASGRPARASALQAGAAPSPA